MLNLTRSLKTTLVSKIFNNLVPRLDLSMKITLKTFCLSSIRFRKISVFKNALQGCNLIFCRNYSTQMPLKTMNLLRQWILKEIPVFLKRKYWSSSCLLYSSKLLRRFVLRFTNRNLRKPIRRHLLGIKKLIVWVL